MLGEQQFQEISEIPLFNLIGHYADTKGYGVVYFKVLMKSYEEKYMHYIHLYKDEDMKVSIYFDDCNYIHFPYYEIYFAGDVERFSNTEKSEMELFDVVKELCK